MISEQKVNKVTGELIEYMKKQKLDPQERILVFGVTAANNLQEMMASEMSMKVYANMIVGSIRT
jgi:hypothetical protein